MALYFEVEKDCFRLVGEKKSNKQKSFFECNFQEGRYFLFVTDMSEDRARAVGTFANLDEPGEIGFCLSYYGEEKCKMVVVEQVDRQYLLN
jgi:hypothetical protein